MFIGIAVAVYLLVVCWVTRLVLISRDPDWPMIWAVLHVANFPLSILLRRIGGVAGNWGRRRGLQRLEKKRWQSFDNFWVPLLLYGLFGALWWAGIAWTVSSAIG